MIKLLTFPAAALLMAAPLFTAPAAAELSARVGVSDLDLSSEAGRATLRARVSRAASKVCPSPVPAQPVARAECRRDAIERAYALVPAVGGNILLR
jgi:UrcA family protein